jgi:hypothetical protein
VALFLDYLNETPEVASEIERASGFNPHADPTGYLNHAPHRAPRGRGRLEKVECDGGTMHAAAMAPWFEADRVRRAAEGLKTPPPAPLAP